MTNRMLQRGFAGGEIAPSLLARTDLPHYKMGALHLDNFIVLPQGAIRKRCGFQFVGTPLNPLKPVRLIPFRYSSTQTYCLEFGDYTMRIISDTGYVLDDNDNIYQISTPYSAENLKNLDYSQNADIITITSAVYPPYELRRYAMTDWRFVRVQLVPTIAAPTNLRVTAVYANAMTDAERATKDKINVTYVVTAFNEDEQESVASQQASGTGNYYINGAKIKVSWDAVAGAIRYRLYRNVSGIFGYVGETENLYIEDEGLNANTNITPPKYKTLFSDTSNQITSISIDNAGSGYNYALIGILSYLPRTLTIDAIQPFVKQGTTEAEVQDWVLENPRIVFINGATLLVEKTFNVTVDYKIVEIDGTYYKVAYLSAPLTMELSSSKQSIASLSIRFVCDNATTDKQYLEGVTEQPQSKSGNTQFNAFDSGLNLTNFLLAFPQSTTVQFPLTITDVYGVNANIDVVAVGGLINQVIINSAGLNYSQNTEATISSSIGSGASFTVNVTGNSVPDYPSACTQYDQRRVFAGSNPHPLKVWFSNAGQQDLMQYHIPVLDDDRIEIEAVTADADRIKHTVALESLILFTSTSELRVYTQNSDALTPKSVAVRAQSYVGANEVQPVVVNSTVVYAASRGGHVRALGYDYNQQGYITQDISIRAPHLFDNYDIVSLTLQKSPIQIVWAVSSNGALYSCTFFPDQNLIAWAQHHTVDGVFENVCAISEGEEDHIYAVIKRGEVRRIERMADLMISTDKTAYRYLDSFLTNTFDEDTSIVTGLNHLNGKEVAVFVDGAQQTNKTVENGRITLDKAGKNIAVGLPLKAELVTLPLITDSEAELQGRTKNITEIYVRVSHDGNLKASNYPKGTEYECKRDDAFMAPQDNDSYLVKVSLDGRWTEQGQIKIVSDDSLPLEIQAVISNISFEGGK